MRFSINLLGLEVFSIDFSLPSKGIYPVPDYFLSESEIIIRDDDN